MCPLLEKDTLKKYEIKSDKVIVVAGGETRNDTIMNGIQYIEEQIGLNDDDIIITHYLIIIKRENIIFQP